jgi:hypothetical protein
LLNEVLSRVDSELNVAAIASYDFGVKDSFWYFVKNMI